MSVIFPFFFFFFFWHTFFTLELNLPHEWPENGKREKKKVIEIKINRKIILNIETNVLWCKRQDMLMEIEEGVKNKAGLNSKLINKLIVL